jgi:hypothetical protein
MPYEIDDGAGRCLYRGDDLELACELHDQYPSARLVILPATTGAGPARGRASAECRHPGCSAPAADGRSRTAR